MFLLYINDLHEAVQYSELNIFADDVALYNEIKSSADYDLLQEDLNNVYFWSTRWQLRLSPVRLSVSLTSILQSPRLTLLIVYHFDGPLQYAT